MAVTPEPEVNTVAARVRTVCHRCDGAGTVHYSLAAATASGQHVLDCATRPCSLCGGQHWLPGLVPPI